MNKERAREYLIKSKIYRFIALIFTGGGFVLFAYVYVKNSDGGNLLVILRNPFTLVFLIFPFIPAITFSFMAKHCEKKLLTFLAEDSGKQEEKK